MENQQTAPIPDTQYTQTLSASTPPQPPGKKKWLWAVITLILLVALFFTPIPYYQNETICTMFYPSSTCSRTGWHLGPSLFTRITVQLPQNNSQSNTKNLQQSISSSDINGFPIYPTAIFVKKDTIPPCSGEVSGYSVCDATTYLWQTKDDFDAVDKWYREDKSNSGWKCSGGAGWYDGPRNAYGKTTCRKDNLAYDLFLSADATKTEITISIPNKTTQANPTANWKTYTDANLAMSFQYPNTWEYEEEKVTVIHQDKKYKSTDINFGPVIPQKNRHQYINPADEPKVYDEFTFSYTTSPDFENVKIENFRDQFNLDKVKGLTSVSWKDTIVGKTLPAKAAYYSGCQSGDCLNVILKKDRSFFEFSIGNGAHDQETMKQFSQILQTFRFTDQASVSPTPIEGSFCGGYTGIICPKGYICKYENTYPDAGGKCMKK